MTLHFEDQIKNWINNNSKEIEKYKGMRVAIHPTKGIVSSGKTYDEMLVDLKSKTIEDVVFYIVYE